MKKTVGLMITIILLMICAFALADVKIDKKNFPDQKFRSIVQKRDIDKNGKLDKKEIKEIVSLSISNMGITNLKGIEYFTNLKILKCSENKLKKLDGHLISRRRYGHS